MDKVVTFDASLRDTGRSDNLYIGIRHILDTERLNDSFNEIEQNHYMDSYQAPAQNIVELLKQKHLFVPVLIGFITLFFLVIGICICMCRK